MLTYSYHIIPFHTIPSFFVRKRSLTMLSVSRVFISPSTPLAFVIVFTPADLGMFLALVVMVKIDSIADSVFVKIG